MQDKKIKLNQIEGSEEVINKLKELKQKLNESNSISENVKQRSLFHLNGN